MQGGARREGPQLLRTARRVRALASEKNDRVIAFIRRITVNNERNPTVLGDLR